MTKNNQIEEMDAYIEKVRQDSERCIAIFLGNLPDTECEKCTYKGMGVNCVGSLIGAQAVVIKELEKRNNEQR